MPNTKPLVLLPEILEECLAAVALALALRIPEDPTYFSGHFPGMPIVPGVVQTHWAVHFARQYWGIRLSFHHMEAVKFKNLILPDQRLTSAYKLEFDFRSENRAYRAGKIYFQGEDIHQNAPEL